MIALYGLSTLIALIELARERYLTGAFWFSMGIPRSPIGPIMRACLLAIPLIWIRYFQISKRVKATFIY